MAETDITNALNTSVAEADTDSAAPASTDQTTAPKSSVPHADRNPGRNSTLSNRELLLQLIGGGW